MREAMRRERWLAALLGLGGVLVFAEQPNHFTLIGGLLISASTLWIARASRAARRAELLTVRPAGG